MEKSKKKRSSHSRKRRIQLDENEGSYSRSHSSSTSELATSTRSSTSRSTTVSSAAGNINITVTTSSTSRSTNNLLSALPISCIPTRGHSSISTESKSQKAKTPPVNVNGSNPNSESVASTSSPGRPGSSSPDPNCAICLGKLENKSFTDSCFHQFCFVCLVEWSKVKAECPLCKQSFKSIVHNVRSYDDYDQYHIPPPEDRNPMHELSVPGGFRFRYRTTVTDHRYATLADRINREIESRLLQRPSRALPIPNYRRLRQPANSEFRRNVYLQRLKLNSDQLNTRRRVRETSPTFFRDNPAQTHRLVPWLNRELIALLQGHGEQTAFVLDLIMGLIKRFPMDSEEFYQHVFPYIGRHTRHFMQEFLMFARSPYHMAAYDRHCTYGPSEEPHHDSDSDSDHRPATVNDGNDSDVIVVSPGNSPVVGGTNIQPPPPRRQDPNLDNWETSLPSFGDQHMLGFAPIMRTYRNEDLPSMHPYSGLRTDNAPTSASGWDSPTPGPSQLEVSLTMLGHPSPSREISNSRLSGGSIWTPSSRSYSAPITQPLPSSSSIFGSLFTESLSLMPRNPPTSTDTSISQDDIGIVPADLDSNGSDLEIVEVEKPWNERSPIHVSSGGDTDYDVMITGTTHINDPVKTEKKKKKHKRKHDDLDTNEVPTEKRKRSTDKAKEKHSKKKRHRSRSPGRHNHSRSRSKSVSPSPVKLTIYRAPNYQHKKFSYKTLSDEADGILQYTNRRSRSVSSMESDTESHVSITSHRKSSKSRHSSIEIVEYRKKSSKLKKNKKHKKNKGKVKEKATAGELECLPCQHRKHSNSSYEFGSSHKKHKHKSKKKKHRKEIKVPNSNTEDRNDFVCSPDTLKNSAPRLIYTSDSDPDSISDFEEDREKIRSESTNKIPSFGSSRLEFVEVDTARAAAIDEELDQLSKTLMNNDYIGSLLKGENEIPGRNAREVANSNEHRLNNFDSSQKSFKKHPYGHKKSGKAPQHNTMSLDNTSSCAESSGMTRPQQAGSDTATRKPQDNIQSHDISSCSDIDKQLPSFLTFSNRNSDFQSYQRTLDFFHNLQTRADNYDKGCPATAASYDSPTSTGLLNSFENEQVLNTILEVDNQDDVDVDTISDDSDIDVTGESVSFTQNNFTNRISQLNTNSSALIDVVGNSDDEPAGQNLDNAMSPPLPNKDDKVLQDSECCDSDIECSLIEGHKTFEINEDSDDEKTNRRLEFRERSEEIDVTTNSDEDTIIPDDEGRNESDNHDNSAVNADTSKEFGANNESRLGHTALSSALETLVSSNDNVAVSDSDTYKYVESEESTEDSQDT